MNRAARIGGGLVELISALIVGPAAALLAADRGIHGSWVALYILAAGAFSGSVPGFFLRKRIRVVARVVLRALLEVDCWT